MVYSLLSLFVVGVYLFHIRTLTAKSYLENKSMRRKSNFLFLFNFAFATVLLIVIVILAASPISENKLFVRSFSAISSVLILLLGHASLFATSRMVNNGAKFTTYMLFGLDAFTALLLFAGLVVGGKNSIYVLVLPLYFVDLLVTFLFAITLAFQSSAINSRVKLYRYRIDLLSQKDDDLKPRKLKRKKTFAEHPLKAYKLPFFFRGNEEELERVMRTDFKALKEGV